jgi:hypothetical protein
MTGMQVDRQVLGVAENWLQSTHANVGVHVADSPQDDLLSVDIGQPITVAFTDSGLDVAGMPIPLAMDTGLIQSTVQAYGVEQAQVCWQGTELRWLINGQQMPYVTADAGWLTETTQLLGWQVLPLHEKLEQIVADLEVPIAVALDPANVPTAGCGMYQAAQAGEASMAFAVEGTWNQEAGELDLKNVDLPFSMFGMLPIGISAQFRLPEVAAAQVPAAVNSVDASLGANGLMATVNDVDVAIHWDSQLLSNLANVTDPLGVGPTIRQVAPVLNMAQVNLDIGSMRAIGASE